MLLESMRVTVKAALEIFLLAAAGYFLVRKNILKDAGLDTLSRLVVEVTLPVLIFCQLVKEFSFSAYSNWWLFPLISIAITIFALAVGLAFAGFIDKDRQRRMQFLSLVTFQNSGYLPLALIVTLLPAAEAGPMLIYLFLFLLGFNLIMWSVGVYMLTFSAAKKFEMASFFSPPVAATLFSLLFIFLGLNTRTPDFIIRPLRMLGDCTLPLAMLVVGGNLAQIHFGRVDKKAMFLLTLAKLIILPALGLWLVAAFRLPGPIGLLILMQLAVPPATSLSVIIRHYKKDDLLISQGIFFGHILGLVTLPLFLSLYFALLMIK